MSFDADNIGIVPVAELLEAMYKKEVSVTIVPPKQEPWTVHLSGRGTYSPIEGRTFQNIDLLDALTDAKRYIDAEVEHAEEKG